jgi:hypothetical protein
MTIVRTDIYVDSIERFEDREILRLFETTKSKTEVIEGPDKGATYGFRSLNAFEVEITDPDQFGKYRLGDKFGYIDLFFKDAPEKTDAE